MGAAHPLPSSSRPSRAAGAPPPPSSRARDGSSPASKGDGGGARDGADDGDGPAPSGRPRTRGCPRDRRPPAPGRPSSIHGSRTCRRSACRALSSLYSCRSSTWWVKTKEISALAFSSDMRETLLRKNVGLNDKYVTLNVCGKFFDRIRACIYY